MKHWLAALTLGIMTINFAHADQNTLEKNLKINFEDAPTKVIGKTPFKDIYEIQVGNTLVYTDENARHFFVGNLIDFKTKENLTAKTEQELGRIDASKLPLENAIKHVRGDGKRVLYVFSDPDCPYCKRLEQALTGINNVTIYTFLFPLASLHPNAVQVSKQIWCATNQYEAWEDYMLHGQLNNSSTGSCENPIDANVALGRSLNITGTPTLFLKDGKRLSGGRETAEIEKALAEQK